MLARAGWVGRPVYSCAGSLPVGCRSAGSQTGSLRCDEQLSTGGCKVFQLLSKTVVNSASAGAVASRSRLHSPIASGCRMSEESQRLCETIEGGEWQAPSRAIPQSRSLVVPVKIRYASGDVLLEIQVRRRESGNGLRGAPKLQPPMRSPPRQRGGQAAEVQMRLEMHIHRFRVGWTYGEDSMREQ